MDDRLTISEGSVSVRDGMIAAVGAVPDAAHDTVIDARGGYLLPGFIQTHVHLCQTLFRGFADDMPLLEWLRERVWPMERHTPSTLRASVRWRGGAAAHRNPRIDDGAGTIRVWFSKPCRLGLRRPSASA